MVAWFKPFKHLKHYFCWVDLPTFQTTLPKSCIVAHVGVQICDWPLKSSKNSTISTTVHIDMYCNFDAFTYLRMFDRRQAHWLHCKLFQRRNEMGVSIIHYVTISVMWEEAWIRGKDFENFLKLIRYQTLMQKSGTWLEKYHAMNIYEISGDINVHKKLLTISLKWKKEVTFWDSHCRENRERSIDQG